MRLFVGKLLSVETGKYNNLVFMSSKFDFGLKKMVECSESIGISDECQQFIPNYKSHIGETIAVTINTFRKKTGGLCTFVQSDILDIEELFNRD
uniref:Uncharacterized protein n=1 Tax=Dulem virus 65 TaxID=3145776 RepID=A0AAU8BAC6_9VIRU